MPECSPYFHYPLAIGGRTFKDDGTAIKPEITIRSIVFRKTPYGWCCMACEEAGNEWFGSDRDAHFEAHKMGLDYARILFRQNPNLL